VIGTYVALGDSFTAGLDPAGECRWADEVARTLPAAHYENLASIGATSEDVEQFQLPEALALDPDLVTLVCGANDVLESVRPDASAYAMRLLRMFGRIRDEAPGALVMTMSYPDLSRFVPLRPRTEARVKRGMDLYNEALRGVARRRGVIVLEAAGHPEAGDRDNFADDGFHASADGHRRIAAGVVSELRRMHERVG
jgi:phosphatidylinositol alpha 1,6-mannosyltransferase